MEPYEVIKLYKETNSRDEFIKEVYDITGADEKEAGWWWDLIDAAK